MPRIVGRWSGTDDEGVLLTLEVYPAPGREISYEFSDGNHKTFRGTFTLRGKHRLEFTPTGAAKPQRWTYSFDDQWRLHLRMGDKNAPDSEEYTLRRAGQ